MNLKASSNKHFIQLGIGEVEAEGDNWKIIGSRLITGDYSDEYFWHFTDAGDYIELRYFVTREREKANGDTYTEIRENILYKTWEKSIAGNIKIRITLTDIDFGAFGGPDSGWTYYIINQNYNKIRPPEEHIYSLDASIGKHVGAYAYGTSSSAKATATIYYSDNNASALTLTHPTSNSPLQALYFATKEGV